MASREMVVSLLLLSILGSACSILLAEESADSGVVEVDDAGAIDGARPPISFLLLGSSELQPVGESVVAFDEVPVDYELFILTATRGSTAPPMVSDATTEVTSSGTRLAAIFRHRSPAGVSNVTIIPGAGATAVIAAFVAVGPGNIGVVAKSDGGQGATCVGAEVKPILFDTQDFARLALVMAEVEDDTSRIAADSSLFSNMIGGAGGLTVLGLAAEPQSDLAYQCENGVNDNHAAIELRRP